jgi:small-conductance mechanosensitive channel
VDGAIRRWLWYGRLAENGRSRVPDIVIGLASLSGYGLTVLAVASLMLGLDVTAVAATSGVVAIVLGVSAQQTLGQVFAGLALNLSRPFRIGDSLQVDGIWGRVMQADWRAVTLRTYEGTQVTLPNTLVAAARLTNLQTPADILRHAIPFVVEIDAPPGRVQAVALDAMAGMETVLSTPAPLVLLKNFEERGVLYEALFWHRDPNLYILCRDEVGQAFGMPCAAPAFRWPYIAGWWRGRAGPAWSRLRLRPRSRACGKGSWPRCCIIRGYGATCLRPSWLRWPSGRGRSATPRARGSCVKASTVAPCSCCSTGR